ncbi:MAG TPA: hypothetical protein P5277_04610 [Candidatus Paceibacterota bacterium]|nr:hypothetical protein [Candidatus Paceibacterota bacterium]
MKRKIIKQGHNTLTITLPSEWVKKLNLSSGGEIDVCERDNGLFLSTEKNNLHRKKEVDLDDMDIPTVWKYFMACYREGYDEIVVNFKPDKRFDNPYKFITQHHLDSRYIKDKNQQTVLEFIHGVVNRFIGFEIVDHGKNYVIIKDMGEPSSREFDNALRRIFLLLQEMIEETCNGLREEDPQILAHIPDVDINLDKFHDYCIRILNKIGNKDSRKTHILFTTLYLLELMGDEFKNISTHLIRDFSKSEFKNIFEIADSIKEQIDLFYSLFYQYDLKKVMKISEIDQKRYANVTKVFKKTTKEEDEIFHHLRIVTRYINALTELRIEMEF